MDSESLIKVEKRGHLAILWLNRPEALNALTFEMIAEFNQEVARAATDPDVAAICITGMGRGFCAGLDVGALLNVAKTSDRHLEKRGIDPEMPAQFANLLQVGKPVIAAVNGPAVGMGFILSMMCDLRFVSEEASFITVFSHRGLVPEHGITWFLPKIVGHSRAMDLLWSSRKVGAEEAFRIGLADRMTSGADLLDTVEAYVEDLAVKAAPRSISIMKELVYRHMQMPMDEALKETDHLVSEGAGHPDTREGVESFREKRPPRFTPWPDK